MKAINKVQVFKALEEALQNITQDKPKFCSKMCFRKKGHKGACVTLFNYKEIYEKAH